MATLDKQVAASADDCRAVWDGSAWSFSITLVAIDVGYSSSTSYKRGGGMRFTNITIPKGSTITSAYITFTSYVTRTETTVNSKVRGEAADDAAQFSDYTDYSGRPRTTAQVGWNNIPVWTLDVEYNSPDISSIIQEIINRAGWASGNDLVIFWDDHDDLSSHSSNCQRRAYSYDGSASKAPKLHIEYTPPPGGGAHTFAYIMG